MCKRGIENERDERTRRTTDEKDERDEKSELALALVLALILALLSHPAVSALLSFSPALTGSLGDSASI